MLIPENDLNQNLDKKDFIQKIILITIRFKIRKSFKSQYDLNQKIL